MNLAPASTTSENWSTPVLCAISGLRTGKHNTKRGVDAGNGIEVPHCAQAQAAEVAVPRRQATDAESLVGAARQGDLARRRAEEHPDDLPDAVDRSAGGAPVVQAIHRGWRPCAWGSSSGRSSRDHRAQGLA